MKTQKELIKFHKETRGEFTVMSFINNKRYSSYGGLNLFEAFREMVYRSSIGNNILLFDKRGNDGCQTWEMNFKTRISLSLAQKFALKII